MKWFSWHWLNHSRQCRNTLITLIKDNIYITQLLFLTGFGTKDFNINDAPIPGECTVEPSVGFALDTRFNVHCSMYCITSMDHLTVVFDRFRHQGLQHQRRTRPGCMCRWTVYRLCPGHSLQRSLLNVLYNMYIPLYCCFWQVSAPRTSTSTMRPFRAFAPLNRQPALHSTRALTSAVRSISRILSCHFRTRTATRWLIRALSPCLHNVSVLFHAWLYFY